MTTRDRNLVILVGIVAGICLIFSGIFRGFGGKPSDNSVSTLNLQQTQHLLRSQMNIRFRNQTTKSNLLALESRFYSEQHPEKAQLTLLSEIENIAAEVNLEIENKNTYRLKQQEIGVSFEGKSSVDSIIGFMQKLTTSKIGLIVKRLQFHAMEDKKILSYRIDISTLLEKDGQIK